MSIIYIYRGLVQFFLSSTSGCTYASHVRDGDTRGWRLEDGCRRNGYIRGATTAQERGGAWSARAPEAVEWWSPEECQLSALKRAGIAEGKARWAVEVATLFGSRRAGRDGTHVAARKAIKEGVEYPVKECLGVEDTYSEDVWLR